MKIGNDLQMLMRIITVMIRQLQINIWLKSDLWIYRK